MKYRLIDADGPRTYIAILETGDEIATSLNRLAEENKLAGSSFKAIGALSGAKVGWFNWETKKYETAAEFEEQLEVLSLIWRYCAQGRPAGRPCASDRREKGWDCAWRTFAEGACAPDAGSGTDRIRTTAP